MKNPIHRLTLLLAATALALSGCGGAGSEDATTPVASRSASARFSIVWPDATKLVPIAAKAVQIDVLQGSTRVASKVAARGAAGSTTVLDLENLPAGKLTFEASALPNVDLSGVSPTTSGVPQARGSAPLTTEPGKTAKIAITMASTIERLAIFPNPWQLEKLKPSVPARATAYDAQNRVVLTDPNRQFTWSSSNTGIVDISPNSGAVNANEKGFATLTVRDRESGKTATSQVEVVDEVLVDRVVANPATATITPRATLKIVASALDVEGNDLEYTPDKFTFTSSDPTKATVDEGGNVTGVDPGAITIEVKEKVTGKSAIVNLEVAVEGGLYISISYQVQRILSPTNAEPVAIPSDARMGSVKVTRRGSKMFFLVKPDDSTAVQRVCVMNLDGSGRRQLISYPNRVLVDYVYYYPNIDGSKLLIERRTNTGNPDQLQQRWTLMEVASGSEVDITLPPNVNLNDTFANPHVDRFSPSGDRYEFEQHEYNSNGRQVINYYVASISGQILGSYPIDANENPEVYSVGFNSDGTRAIAQDATVHNLLRIYDGAAHQVGSVTLPRYSRTLGWHPSRNSIVYFVNDGSGPIELRERSLDSGADVLLYSTTSVQYDVPWIQE